MDIGIINELSHFEMRVALTPQVVESLVNKGNRVFFEKGAGEGSKFSDQEFIDAGAQIAYSKEEAIGRAELVLMVSPINEQESQMLKERQIVMSFHHMAIQKKEIISSLIEKKITTVGYEIIENEEGELPVLISMSEIAGQMSIIVAAQLLQNINGGRGILMANTPGTSPPSVVILGAGVVGLSAARMAIGVGAQVTLIDSDIQRLRKADEVLGKRALTWIASKNRITRACKFADVLIGAILVKGGRAPHIVSEKMVQSMKKGSCIIDVSIDQGGCIETSTLTNVLKPTYEKHGVIHYCVSNMPAAVARTSTYSLVNATHSYIFRTTRLGIKEAMKQDSSLSRGVYTHDGKYTQKIVAEIFNSPYIDIRDLI